MEGARRIVSCASCRQRKNFSCVYSAQAKVRGARSRQQGDDQLSARIRHLENLVNTIVTQGSPTRDDVAFQHRETSQNASTTSSTGPTVSDGDHDSAGSVASDIKPGQVLLRDNQMVYVSSMHWSSLCTEIADIRDQFDDVRSRDPGDVETDDLPNAGGPMLLSGVQTTTDFNRVLSDVPTKDVADKLIFRYFNSVENSIPILHGPTFEKEYRRFWHNPLDVSVPWVALLFGVLAMGTLMCLRAEESTPPALGSPAEAMSTFQRRSTDCLQTSDYSTRPGPYTIEALLINAQNEFVRRRDAHLGVWVLGGMAIRLALRMGYHRDPEHYPQLSPYEGEMRRRIWAVMTQIDGLTSYQLGLPPMINEALCDARLPRNLHDEDFDSDSAFLPPSRPATELTPVLYLITKAELSAVFRTVFTRVVLGQTQSYDDIMALHRRLESAREALSPRFRGFNLEDSVTVAPYLMIRRYTLEILYQKTVCMLHRHHMTKSYQNPEYIFSRNCCLDAAMSIVTHHTAILRQMWTGGSLYRNAMFVSSLEQADFLLASIIVCLELSSRAQHPTTRQHEGSGLKVLRYTDIDLMQALQDAHRCLDEAKEKSAECRQAFGVLSAMLRKFNERVAGQEKTNATKETGTASIIGNMNAFVQPVDSNGGGTQSAAEPISRATSTPSSFQELNSFFSSPDAVDWDLWEAFLRDSALVE